MRAHTLLVARRYCYHGEPHHATGRGAGPNCCIHGPAAGQREADAWQMLGSKADAMVSSGLCRAAANPQVSIVAVTAHEQQRPTASNDSEVEGGRCAWEALPQHRLLVSPALHTSRAHVVDEAECQAWCEAEEHCIG